MVHDRGRLWLGTITVSANPHKSRGILRLVLALPDATSCEFVDSRVAARACRAPREQG